MDQVKIGKMIAKLRYEKGMTQAELGEMLGVSYKAVSKWERGINLPDSSLFKPLSDLLGITVDELISGNLNDNKLDKRNNIVLVVIGIIILIIGTIFIFVRNRNYPKVDKYSIEVIENGNNKYVNQLLYKDVNIWYYGIDNVRICDGNFTCYNFGIAINHGQITIDDIHLYFDNEVTLGNAKVLYLRDGGSMIYEYPNYVAIFCNTISGNHDIYFGTHELLNNNYCGHKIDKIKYFTRTYHILNVYPDNDSDYLNVTLSSFQGDIATIKLNKKYSVEVDNSYEFKFYTYKLFDDSIDNIFTNASLASVTKTNKVGLEQINEAITISE